MARNLVTTNITSGAAMPIKKGTLDFLQAKINEADNDAMMGLFPGGSGEFQALYGCKNSGSSVVGGTAIISAGAFVFQQFGLIYRAPSASFVIGLGETIVGNWVTTNHTNGSEADPVTFTNGATHNVHKIFTLVWSSGVSGSGAFDFADLKRPLRKKQLNIGDWNMNYSAAGSASKQVAHGLANHKKIRGVQVFIQTDNGVDVSFGPYGGFFNYMPLQIDGTGNFAIDATNIMLGIGASSQFNSASFNATGYNRGYILLEYED